MAFSISPRNQSKSFIVTNALAIKKLSLSERKINWPVVKCEWGHIADLDLPAINSDLVTVLLGRDTRGVHDTYETLRSEDDTAPEPYKKTSLRFFLMLATHLLQHCVRKVSKSQASGTYVLVRRKLALIY